MVNIEKPPARELPAEATVGLLEPVAYFNGAMPTHTNLMLFPIVAYSC